MTEEEEEIRLTEAILIVLYEVYPLALTEAEIKSRIEERGLDKMSVEEFAKYKKGIFDSRVN